MCFGSLDFSFLRDAFYRNFSIIVCTHILKFWTVKCLKGKTFRRFF